MLFAALSAALLLLTACGEQAPPPDEIPEETAFTLTVALGEAPADLDPARCTAEGGETILLHLYENLLRWEDNGIGFAALVPGQAESYTVETDYLGNATYTFTLRDDIYWSDGQSVTAHHFVSAWQRLANPAHAFPHSSLLSCIKGYDTVQEGGDVSLLGISAVDNRTLVVQLNGNPPSFLYKVCTGAYTMPVRSFLTGNAPITSVTNGAYTLAAPTESGEAAVVLTKSSTYYDAARVTVDCLRFIPSGGSDTDYAKFLQGSVSFTTNLPAAALNKIGTPEPVTSTYGIVFNTRVFPFDSIDIRTAFRLAVDEQAVIDALNDLTLRPAVGPVPYGFADYSAYTSGKTIGTDQNTTGNPPLVYTGANRDFRAHSEEIVTLNISSDYAADCEKAQQLLASAGYPNGYGFPQVEYLYIDTPENSAVAAQLQTTWKQVLGVTVTLRAVTAEEYAQLLTPGVQDEAVGPTYWIAAAEFTAADRYDIIDFLHRWHSSDARNSAGYSSAAFDILLKAAGSAAAPETYDAYLHDAEAILLEDAPVVALFYRGGSYALADGLTGLYRLPNGVYFFSRVYSTEK